MAKPTGARVEHTDFQNVPIFTAISGDELLRVRCGIWALESGYWRYAARVASHLLAHLSLIFLFQYYWRDQSTISCATLESGIGWSGDPRRKWESERGREKKKRKVLLLFAKWSKRTMEMQKVYILPLWKPGLRHLSRLSKKSNICFKKK